jgi:predicted metal-dependent hydrolase
MDTYDVLGYFIIGCVVFACIYVYFDSADDFILKCIVSGVDGNKYCVRERSKLNQASDLLAKVTENCKNLVAYVQKKHPEKENVKRLVKNFNPKKISETLPTSSYTAYSENKGEKLAFCLNKKKENNEDLIDEHTLTFVALHELSHVMTKEIGHGSTFWENFKFLLEQAKEAGIHEPADYKKKPQNYCGMTVKDNPFFDT